MNQKHIFIIKPNPNNAKIETLIVKNMRGYPYEIKYTRYPKHASAIAASYRGCHHRIYAVGGDGLIHEVVQGLVGSENELVVLPAGTGNDFIRSIADTRNLETLLKKSLRLQAQPIDLIKVNDIYCINVFCLALDSDVANNVHKYRQIKVLPRSLQYVNVLVRRFVKYRPLPTTLRCQGKIIYRDKLLIGAFCNGKYFGGGFKIGKCADVKNGLIDINLVPELKKSQLPYYVTLLLTERLEHGELYYHTQLKEVEVESNKEVNIDGEVYPAGIYHLKIVNKAINVVLFEKND